MSFYRNYEKLLKYFYRMQFTPHFGLDLYYCGKSNITRISRLDVDHLLHKMWRKSKAGVD